MFNNFKNILIGVLSAVLVIAVGASAYTAFASSAGKTTAPAAAPIVNAATGNWNGNGQGNGQGSGNGTGTGTGITTIPASELSAEEAAGLLYMREEEKLARDVYNQMYTLWRLPVFQNIASSEQTHMDQIKLLLDRYNLSDPALAAGQFSDPNLQALYDKLVAQGSTSSVEALNVGAVIEQTDIADLQARLAQTDNADIQLIYNNLMNGSYNHLAAFTGGQQGGNGQGNGGASGQGQGGQSGHGRPAWAGSGSGYIQQP